MRLLWIISAFALLGCGPNRKVEPGTVKVDKVETVPSNQFMATPGKK